MRPSESGAVCIDHSGLHQETLSPTVRFVKQPTGLHEWKEPPMRLIDINPNLNLEVAISTEEILADLIYPDVPEGAR